jgi:dTMP kinase
MLKLNLCYHSFPGRLIVFTGIDGSGKTTLLNEVDNYLKTKKLNTVKFKMPSDDIRNMKVFRNFHDNFNEIERTIISNYALTVMVTGDRLISLERDVIPALKLGKYVLLDRYQFTALTICNNNIILELTNSFLRPDCVFWADAGLDIAKKRVLSRVDENDKFYDDSLAEYATSIYQELTNSNDYFYRIDTSISIQNSYNDMIKIINDSLNIQFKE